MLSGLEALAASLFAFFVTLISHCNYFGRGFLDILEPRLFLIPSKFVMQTWPRHPASFRAGLFEPYAGGSVAVVLPPA